MKLRRFRNRALAAALLALALLLSGCVAAQVDITTAAPAPTAAPTPTPAPTPSPTPEAGDMVRAVDIIHNLYTDVRYATADNFTGVPIYNSAEAYLRYSTAVKLARVQERLNAQGLSLCIWDGWRSVAAQFALWRAYPDARYVADPFNGVSGHCRGNTVDITLLTLTGEPVEMPTDFDDFTARADHDYSDVSAVAAANARLLEREMAAEGFTGYEAEWWHYTDLDAHGVVEALTRPPELRLERPAALRRAPDTLADVTVEAASGKTVIVLDELDGWLLVRCGGVYGYIQDDA